MDIAPNVLEDREGASPASRRRVGMQILGIGLLAGILRTVLAPYAGDMPAKIIAILVLVVAVVLILRRARVAL